MQRSAPSESRTSTNCRNQCLSTAGSVSPPGSGRTAKRGAIPAQSSATADRPWWSAFERPTGGHVEASVVPVAGQDPAVQRPAVEREAHVWAAVVDRSHVVAVGEQRQRVPVHVRDERAESANVVEGGSAKHGSSLGAR